MIIKINGVAIKDPQTYQWDISDLDSEDGTGRNQRGEMFRDRIAVKRKLSCSWGPLNNAEMSTLLNAVKDTYFTVEFPDAMSGGRQTMTAYVGDRSAPMYRHKGVANWIWEGLTMNFIER